jgi:hypothetical protein
MSGSEFGMTLSDGGSFSEQAGSFTDSRGSALYGRLERQVRTAASYASQGWPHLIAVPTQDAYINSLHKLNKSMRRNKTS